MAAPLRRAFLKKLQISSKRTGSKTTDTQTRLTKQFATTADNVKSWQLHSAVYLQRYPVITREMTEMEQKFKAYVDKIDLNDSLLSDHEITIKKEKAGVKAGIVSALDYEDQWQATYDNFKLASRVTEDEANDKSLNRKLEEKLFLIVKYKFENSESVWGLPNIQVKEGESMREAAERALSTKCGDDIQATFMGNAPCGYSDFKLPHSFNEYGVKLFYFKALYRQGDVAVFDNVSEYKWVSLQESKDFLYPHMYKQITEFDMDF